MCSHGFKWWRYGALFCVLVLASGCHSYNWVLDYSQFAQAEQRAREKDKHMFVFYKCWTDEASNRMLGSEVLSDPDVESLFQDTINLLVEEAGGPKYVAYMNKYGVSHCPASVIVAPDGTYQVRSGFVPKEEFVEFAKKTLNASSAKDKQRANEP